jgi:hypothetical protein
MCAAAALTVPDVSISRPLVLGSTDQLLQATRSLLRLQKLDAALQISPLERDETLQAIQRIWREALGKIHSKPTLESVRDMIHRDLDPFHQVQAFYDPELKAASSLDEIAACARRALGETCSILVPPLKKASLGKKGPTFLVNFVDADQHPQAFVIKYSAPLELGSTRLYEALAHCPEIGDEAAHTHGFDVPHAAGLDLIHGLHERPDGMQIKLTDQDAGRLENQFAEIAQSFYSTPRVLSRQILFSERIFGGTLFDFAHTQYTSLSDEEKMKFFSRLARLAFLDIILGNLDRLIKFAPGDECALDGIESNLANVLVVATEKGFILEAIDNEIEPELIHNESEKEKYLLFLQKLLSSGNFEVALARSMVESMQSGIQRGMEDALEDGAADPSEVGKIRASFKPFLKDLQEIAFKAFCEGVHGMAKHLQKILPESEGGMDLLVSGLREKYPELAAAVWQRLHIFKTIRIHS